MKIYNCKCCGAPLDDSLICSYCGSYHLNVSKHSLVKKINVFFSKLNNIEPCSDYIVPISRGGVRL